MSLSNIYRKRAEAERVAAAATNLPNHREQLLRSAEAWERIAQKIEFTAEKAKVNSKRRQSAAGHATMKIRAESGLPNRFAANQSSWFGFGCPRRLSMLAIVRLLASLASRSFFLLASSGRGRTRGMLGMTLLLDDCRTLEGAASCLDSQRSTLP